MNRYKLLFILFWVLALFSFAACGDGSGDEGALLFQESFTLGEMAEWDLERDALGQTSIQDGQLFIDLNAPNIMQFATLPDMPFADFTLEVDARQLRGDLGNSYGVLLRMQDNTQFYRFEITGNGMYMIERRNADGSWTRYVDTWTDHPAINQGLNVSNTLRVEADGAEMKFFVNDVLIQEIQDSLYVSGTIALNAGTFIQPNMQVAFDNLVLRQP